MGARILLVVLLLGASAPRSVAMHGALRHSSPAKGATLQRVPRELRLTFTEPVELAVTRVTLVSPDGRPVSLRALAIPSDSAVQVVAAIEGGMIAGRYTVHWQVAGPDGHPVRGDFTFDVAPGAEGVLAEGVLAEGETASVAPHHDPATFPTSAGTFDVSSPAYVAVRWFTYLAVVGVIGAAAFRFGVLGRVSPFGDAAGNALIPAAAESSARVGAISSGLLLLAAAVRLVAQSVVMHGAETWQPAAMLPMLTATMWGRGWLLLVAAGMIGVFGYRLAQRHGRRHELLGWRIAAGAGGLAAIALALSGHAVAVPRWRGVAVTADAVHVLGAGWWLGSLGVLLIAGITAARRLDPRLRDMGVAALVRAFSATALVAAALVGGTGVLAAWLHVGTPSALWSSEYGRVLLLKLGFVTLVALTGAYNWRRVLPVLGLATGTRRLQRSARVEVAIAVVVLMITAVLVAVAPPVSMRG